MVKDKCGQSGHGTLKLTYLKSKLIEWTDFVHADANSEKLKVDSMIFGWMWSKMGMVVYYMRP